MKMKYTTRQIVEHWQTYAHGKNYQQFKDWANRVWIMTDETKED